MTLERATAKQLGQLRALLSIVRDPGLAPVTFVTTVVADWSWLTSRVREKTDDASYIPSEPTLGFMARFLGHLISVVQEEAARKVEEAKRDAEREAQHEKDKAEREAAHLARQRAKQAELDALAKQGASFPTKEAAVEAMYRCLGRGDAIQSILGESIRAFLSSWGGDDQLNDAAIFAKYRRNLFNAFWDYCEGETIGDEEQPVSSSVVPFPNAA